MYVDGSVYKTEEPKRLSLAINTLHKRLNKMKGCLVCVFVFLVASRAFFEEVGAAGECGKTPIRSAATSLSPCLSSARNVRAKVPPTCCTKVGALISTAPKCLCAVLLSPLAKQAGINPAIAITIPKRCKIRNRPAGKKCGSKYLYVYICHPLGFYKHW